MAFATPPSRPADTHVIPPRAIIDIGSNSIRLVVFDGPERLPTVLFNEKVMAGLGRNLSSTSMIDDAAMALSVKTMRRFIHLASEMGVASVRAVATAAVREAQNAHIFLGQMAALGINIELLSGAQEAEAAGLGIISAIPWANGIVGDLGGGSLELVRVKNGKTLDWVSVPLGVLRINAIRKNGQTALSRTLSKMAKAHPWLNKAHGLPFYMVGGSWRTLARLDMHLSQWPLPIIDQYHMPPERAAHLVRSLASMKRKTLLAIPTLSNARIPALGDAAALLSTLVRELKSSALIASAAGLREGLLYQQLTKEQRKIDPLIAATCAEGARQGRFPEHGDILHNWIAPLFDDDQADHIRLRHAACQLADVGWHANPDFRAERGYEAALHGNWVGVDAGGRALMAQALATSFGAGVAPMPSLLALAEEKHLRRAVQWGLAMRLGQRLSGGVAGPLRNSKVQINNDIVYLIVEADDAALYGEAVERRHRQLAVGMGLKHQLRVIG